MILKAEADIITSGLVVSAPVSSGLFFSQTQQVSGSPGSLTSSSDTSRVSESRWCLVPVRGFGSPPRVGHGPPTSETAVGPGLDQDYLSAADP